MDDLFRLTVMICGGYLLGAVPTAYLVARVNGVNIFEVGSGNMGATNVSRALGIHWGVLVLILDGAKGVLAILMARLLLPDAVSVATAVGAIVAIVGHNWSIFALAPTGSLRGGKGASTAYGTLLLIAPLYMILVTSVMAAVIILTTRYVSLAALAVFTTVTLWLMVLVSQHLIDPVFAWYALAVFVLIVYRFRENIGRLLTGTERRLGERA